MNPDELTEEMTVRLKVLAPAFSLEDAFSIIQALMSFLSGCGGLGAAEAKEQADSPRPFARLRMRQALQREGFRPRSRELADAETAAWKLAREATVEKLEAFLDLSNEGG